jgi:hypothetical protein
MKRYVYNEKEWESTGRQAVRSNKRDSSKDDVLIEIRPLNETSDEFNKWVRHEELFHIHEVED